MTAQNQKTMDTVISLIGKAIWGFMAFVLVNIWQEAKDVNVKVNTLITSQAANEQRWLNNEKVNERQDADIKDLRLDLNAHIMQTNTITK